MIFYQVLNGEHDWYGVPANDISYCQTIWSFFKQFSKQSTLLNVRNVIEKGQFKIILIYKGKGFDPNDISNPDMKDYFNNFKVGGLGVPIMKKFMNKIEYVRMNSDKNYLTLIKYL